MVLAAVQKHVLGRRVLLHRVLLPLKKCSLSALAEVRLRRVLQQYYRLSQAIVGLLAIQTLGTKVAQLVETWWLRYYRSLIAHQLLVVDLVNRRLSGIKVAVVEIDLMRLQ